MTEERSAGCITFKLINNLPLYALIFDSYGKWTFPKGHIEEGEMVFAAARRELLEEVGIDKVELTTHLGAIKYTFNKDGVTIIKKVEWFLTQADADVMLHANHTEGVKEAEWLEYGEAMKRLGYASVRRLLKLANEIVAMCYTHIVRS